MASCDFDTPNAACRRFWGLPDRLRPPEINATGFYGPAYAEDLLKLTPAVLKGNVLRYPHVVNAPRGGQRALDVTLHPLRTRTPHSWSRSRASSTPALSGSRAVTSTA